MDLTPFYSLINWLVQSFLLPLLFALACTGLMDLYVNTRALVRARIGVQKEAFIFDTVKKYVLVAETYFIGSGLGKQKLAWVLKMAAAYLATRGYKDIDTNQLIIWAEAALKEAVNNYPDLKQFTADEVKLNTDPASPAPTPAPAT